MDLSKLTDFNKLTDWINAQEPPAGMSLEDFRLELADIINGMLADARGVSQPTMERLLEEGTPA